jgi:hypothetical protein
MVDTIGLVSQSCSGSVATNRLRSNGVSPDFKALEVTMVCYLKCHLDLTLNIIRGLYRYEPEKVGKSRGLWLVKMLYVYAQCGQRPSQHRIC